MSSLVQVFEKIVYQYNLVEGQNRGLKLEYTIFHGAIDTLIYELEITNLKTWEKTYLPCFILPEDDPEKTSFKKTLILLDKFIQLTTEL